MNKKLNDFFSEIKDSSNLVVASQEDINEVTKLGNEISFDRNTRTKGAIIFLECTKKLTLEKLGDMAEKITKTLPNSVQVLWGARINQDIKTDKLNVVYVY